MRASILGTGLIGASLGMALRSSGWVTTGWDPNTLTLEEAEGRGAVIAADSVELATDDADLVVLAGPLDANLDLLTTLRTAAVVTDVTSVKRAIIEAAPADIRFVGGHPMAGREHAGPKAASPALFRGAPWIICDDGAETRDLDFVVDMVRSIGADPVRMTAADHDRVVAGISHLPHLLAAVLTSLASDRPEATRLVSGSFRDLTRVAAGDAGWWPEVLSANADEVSVAISTLIGRLEEVESILAHRDNASMRKLLEAARVTRMEMAPDLSRVQVILQDQPGELAAVGRAFAVSHVDVRDLQLRHAEHGGGGVLTITVRPGESQPLRSALEEEGFSLE